MSAFLPGETEMKMTAEQIKATALGTIIETPLGPLEVSGRSHSGDAGINGNTEDYHALTFGPSHAPVAILSNRYGFEPIEQHKARLWDRGLDKLGKQERRLIDIMFGDRLQSPTRYALKEPARLVNVAKARLVKAGKLEHRTCTRCGGSGHYSYNQIDGTRCFGCAGSGKMLPTTADALKAAEAAAQ